MDIHFVGLKKIFCLEDVGILHSARVKICNLSTFPAYGKVGVNHKTFWLACVAGVKGWRVGEGLGGGDEREGRRERLLQEPRLLHFAPLYSNIPAVTSTTRRFRAWENVRYRMSAPRLPQKFVKVGRKPNVNVKKIAVLDFVELTFLQGEDQPHMKIYFRRPEELKVRGWI